MKTETESAARILLETDRRRIDKTTPQQRSDALIFLLGSFDCLLESGTIITPDMLASAVNRAVNYATK